MSKILLLSLILFTVSSFSGTISHLDFLKQAGLNGSIRIDKSYRVPSGNFHTTGEFDTAEGLIVCWDIEQEDLQMEMVKFIAEDTLVYVCFKETVEIEKKLKASGVNMKNIKLIPQSFLIWVRDFGPFWIVNEDGRRDKVVLLNYYGEDVKKLAGYFQATEHSCPMEEAGGNMMFDGRGTAFCSIHMQQETAGQSEEKIREIYRDYFGAEQVIFLKPLRKEGTGHVDLYCKLLDSNTLLLGEYRNKSDGVEGNKELLDENFQTLKKIKDLAGKPYRVERIVMPKYKEIPQVTGSVITNSYLNSLIINKKVLVPVYGLETDQEALETYRKLMPGYTVKGFDCRKIIELYGAVHCITMGVYSSQKAILKALNEMSVPAGLN
ncbi:MAG: agmatine deiminase family protein [Candidatus Wallbacteria bacterium]|nr:agmatine deiminase family protein [Candidatus Wallbacteria bacterium]